MADLPMSKADPPAGEEVPPNLSKLHIDESGKEDEIRLCDLHQFYIDRLCKNLDLESVIRMQLTCKGLYEKGLYAQRLLTCPLSVCYWPEEGLTIRNPVGKSPRTQEQMKATKSRFQVDCFNVWGNLTVDVIKRVTEALDGRGAIKILICRDVDLGDEPALFSKFLQDFKVSEMDVRGIMSEEYFQLPSVKQLTHLAVGDDFPLSLLYFLDTDIHTCSIWLGRDRVGRPDSEEMHAILEKWTRNEKIIKWLHIHGFKWNEDILFSGWKIVDEGQTVPPERPVVIRTHEDKYRVLRAVGTVLCVDGLNWTEFVEE